VADFKETFNPQCVACGKEIEGSVKVEALGKVWHQECFKCPMCPQPFTSLSFVPGDDGNPWCERHFYEKQGLLCCACDMPITEGKRIRIGDKAYHPEHLVCEYCRKHLAGLTYKQKNGKPYCAKCHSALFG
jgi:paxillin